MSFLTLYMSLVTAHRSKHCCCHKMAISPHLGPQVHLDSWHVWFILQQRQHRLQEVHLLLASENVHLPLTEHTKCVS